MISTQEHRLQDLNTLYEKMKGAIEHGRPYALMMVIQHNDKQIHENLIITYRGDANLMGGIVAVSTKAIDEILDEIKV